MALLRSISGLVAGRACARRCCVSLRAVPAWPTGNATNSTEVLAEFDLDNDEDALLSVKGARVRCRGVRNSFGVDQVGGGAVSLPE